MIDIEKLTDIFAGDKAFVAMLFKQHLEDNLDVNRRIQKQFESKHLKVLYLTMHTLSGSLSSLCEMDLVPRIKKVEAISKNDELPDIDDINYIQSELDKIKIQLEQYITE